MNDVLPEPLVPAGIDLSDFTFMPLDVRRLRDSRIAATARGEEFMAAVLLWCASWHQIPAASLPDDDVELAALAGFGRVLKEWKKVRDGALHGWVKCSDGRLYHPVIAEKACESWNSKMAYAWKKEVDRIRKENKDRVASGAEQLPFPPKPEPIFPENSTTSRTRKPRNSSGRRSEFQRNSSGIPAENALKGQGQGEVRDRDRDITAFGNDIPSGGRSADANATATAPTTTAESMIREFDDSVVAHWGGAVRRLRVPQSDMDTATALIGAGVTLDVFRREVDVQFRQMVERGVRPPFNLLGVADDVLRAMGSLASQGQQQAERESDERVQWRVRLVGFAKEKPFWLSSWGPKPGEAGCQAPSDLVSEILPALAGGEAA